MMNFFQSEALKQLRKTMVSAATSAEEVKEIESMVKCISKRVTHDRMMSNLNAAIQSQSSDSPCALVNSVSDEKKRKMAPDGGYTHLYMCRVFRYSWLNSINDLEPTSNCTEPYNKKAKVYCINPYHYNPHSGKLPVVEVQKDRHAYPPGGLYATQDEAIGIPNRVYTLDDPVFSPQSRDMMDTSSPMPLLQQPEAMDVDMRDETVGYPESKPISHAAMIAAAKAAKAAAAAAAAATKAGGSSSSFRSAATTSSGQYAFTTGAYPSTSAQQQYPPSQYPSANVQYPTSNQYTGTSGQYPNTTAPYPATSGRFQSTSGQFPSTSGQFPSTSGQFPTTSGQFPSTSGQFPSTSGQFPSTSGQFPSTSGQFPSTSGQFPSTSGQYPTASGQYQGVQFPTSVTFPNASGQGYPTSGQPSSSTLGITTSPQFPGAQFASTSEQGASAVEKRSSAGPAAGAAPAAAGDGPSTDAVSAPYIIPASRTSDDVKEVPGCPGLYMVPFEKLKVWLTLSYGECDRVIKRVVEVGTYEYTIEYSQTPHKPDKMCLGYFSGRDCALSEKAENIRRAVGRGVRFYYIGGDIMMEVMSRRPVFVQCPAANKRFNVSMNTVLRVDSGTTFKLFSSEEFTAEMHKAVGEGYQSVFELHKQCNMRASFVKGWGDEYNRRTIKQTYSWIMANFPGPSRWVDRVINHMGAPAEFLGSVT